MALRNERSFQFGNLRSSLQFSEYQGSRSTKPHNALRLFGEKDEFLVERQKR